MAEQQTTLTERQQRELEYHREHAAQYRDLLERPFSYEVLHSKRRRWWNAYWSMFTYLLAQDLAGKKVLVVGCGFGDDALRLAKMGAEVYAFDLSPESLEIARGLAKREGLTVDFRELPAEKLDYPSDFFDCVVARDILHHVDIPDAMREIVRVSKEGALFLIDEIYSHSITNTIRHSRFVEKIVYPTMQSFIYKGRKPYITADERKLTENDMRRITAPIGAVRFRKYYNFLVTRLIPDSFDFISRIDRLLMILLKPLAPWLAGRVLMAGTITK